jgi:hypothetical protein
MSGKQILTDLSLTDSKPGIVPGSHKKDSKDSTVLAPFSLQETISTTRLVYLV